MCLLARLSFLDIFQIIKATSLVQVEYIYPELKLSALSCSCLIKA